MADFNEIRDSLVKLDESSLLQLVNYALEKGIPAADILNKGLIAGMDIIGENMQNGDMFIPEVLMAAQLMNRALDILKPYLGDDQSSAKGSVIIGSVKGDLHDIGKDLVAMMLESTGLKVYNLGVDIAPEEFVREIKKKNVSLLCLSALLTTTMPMMKQTVDAVVESGLRDKVKIMVGGATVTQEFADDIGADAYAPDAGSAAKKAKVLVS